MNWVTIFASGLFKFFNQVIATGLLGKAIFLVILTWVVGVMISGLVGWIAGQMGDLTSVDTMLGNFGGDLAAFGLWLFGLFVAPGLSAAIGGRVVAFVIRRLPVIG